MKIELELTSAVASPPLDEKFEDAWSAPLQLSGKFGDVWVYYRARSEKWELWINPDGPATDLGWLRPRTYTPTCDNLCSPYDETDLGFALRQITMGVEYWQASRPTEFTISRELVESVTNELRALAQEESEGGFGEHAAVLLGLVERLTQNPVPKT